MVCKVRWQLLVSWFACMQAAMPVVDEGESNSAGVAGALGGLQWRMGEALYISRLH